MLRGLNFKSSFSTLDISRLMLALLIVSINIREPFFHSREILLVLVALTSIYYIDIRKARYTLILVAIWCVSVLYNTIVPGSDMSFASGGFDTIVVSAYLLLLCFCKRQYVKTIIKSYLFVSTLVAIIIIAVWILCFFSDSTLRNLQAIFANIKQTRGLTIMSIDYRAILGRRFLTVWYRTSPCMACSLGYCLLQKLEKKADYAISVVLFTVALILSGTRANMLSAAILVTTYLAIRLYRSGYKLMSIIFMIAVCAIVLMLAVRFLNDPGSRSSTTKRTDGEHYIDIFLSDPLRSFFFGWAPGSTFYSENRQQILTVTELSLFETIRRYGLISTCVIMLVIWATPLRMLGFRNSIGTKLYCYCIFGCYMLSAFTNPYLLDSVGFCALLFMAVCFRSEVGDTPRVINSGIKTDYRHGVWMSSACNNR